MDVRIYFTLFALFILMPLTGDSAVIGKISFSFPTEETISESFLENQIISAVGDEFNPEQLSEDIQKLYETGYIDDVEAQALTMEDTEQVELRFQITPTPRIRGITISGNDNLRTSSIRDMLPLSEGERLHSGRLAEGRRAIRELYEDSGFHNASVSVSKEEVNQSQVDLLVEINEQERHKVRRVNFSGNQVYSDRQLRRRLNTRRSLWAYIFSTGHLDPRELRADRQILRELYADKGYLDFEIEEVEKSYSRNDKWVTLNFHIQEGEPYKVEEITFNGNEKFSDDELRELLTLEESMTYSRSKRNQDIRSIQHKYGRLGYIDLVCRPQEQTDSDRQTVTVNYQIREGAPSRIRDILIAGNQITQDQVLRRESPLAPGDLADTQKIEQTRTRLRELQYFKEVSVTPLPTEEEGLKDLEIAVKETATGRWGIGGGFSSDTGGFGFVEIEETNFDLSRLFRFRQWPPKGAGQRARFRTTVGSEMLEFNLAFIEPWLFGRRLRLETNLFHQTYDQYEYDEQRTGGRFNLTRQVALGPDSEGRLPWWRSTWRQSIGYRLEYVDLTSFSADASPELLAERGDYIVSAITLGMSRDTRDSFRLPTRGGHIGANLQLQSEAIGAYSNIYKLDLKTNRYFSLGRYPYLETLPILADTVLKLQAEAATVDNIGGDSPAIFDRYFAGGQYTIRGFERRQVSPVDINEDPIGGQSRLLATAELMYPLHEMLWLSVFSDFGNVWRSSWNWNPGELNSSAGIGLQLDLQAIPMRLDYAVPVTTQQDHLDTRGRIHFSLGRSF